MSEPNGNMTTDERRALQPGAVVSYRSERMLSEIQGTVDAVRCSGRLALCDGAFVFSCDYCRLVSAAPMVSTQPNVRGLDGDGVAPASGGPRDAPQTPGGLSVDEGIAGLRALERKYGCFAGCDATAWVAELRGKTPAQDGHGMVRKCQDCGKFFEGATTSRYCPRCRKKRQSKGPGGKRADRELWAQAVQAVDSCRDRGMTTAQAVAMARQGETFVALKLTVGNYRLWRRELKPVEVVHGAAMAKAPAADLAEQLETMRRQLDALAAEVGELRARPAITNGACAVCK